MGASILIVDDERGIRDMLQWELGGHGHEIAAAADGAEAVEKVRNSEFDLVISDLRMPGVNGLQVLRATKDAAPETEVVVATGYAELEYAIECVRGGAFDFIQKPFDVTVLLSTVDRALDRRRLRATAALFEASQVIFSNQDPQRLPELIVQLAMKVMAADDVSLMLPDSDNLLYIAHSHGLSPGIQAEVRLALGERVAGRIAAKGEPVLFANGIDKDPRFPDVTSSGRVRSSIVYPLVSGDRLVGVLNINRLSDGRPFRKQDLERAGVLASQILLALENARLVRKMVTSERLASVGQLAAGVAHEINNPVAYVLATHSYLRQQLASLRALDEAFRIGADLGALRAAWDIAGGHAFLEEFGQALEEIGDGAGRIRDIVRDMRSLARSDDGKPALVDVNEVIRSALRVASAEVRHRAVITAHLGTNVEVHGNAGRLSQVFINLLVNAAQAIGEHPSRRGEVVVSSERQGDSVFARVTDNGPGIRPEHLTRIFETFFTTKGPATGTGLGLSISREIIRGHGGDIRVDSESERGATFTVRLPAASSVAAPAPTGNVDLGRKEEPTCEKDTSTRRFRILFIDDESSILRAYERAFGRNHEVVAAHGGSQALAILAQRHDFSLIVCDLLMADVNGMEIYRRVREAHPELDGTFVFVTGGVTQKDVQAFLRTVGNPVLEKPFDFGALREIIDVRTTRKAEEPKP